jgi:hypothetical protein
MLNAILLTDRFDRALLYATHVHGGQLRKGTSTPYIAHLLAVAATVLEYGGSEDLAIAGLLHDAVEDQGGPPRLSDIRHRFGDRVADVVGSCSDSFVNTAAGESKEPKNIRAKRYLEHLLTVDQETLLVSLCDKVHNARSILRDLRNPEIGQAVFERFNCPKEDTLRYYRELTKTFCKLRPGQLANELGEIVDVLEKDSQIVQTKSPILSMATPDARAHNTYSSSVQNVEIWGSVKVDNKVYQNNEILQLIGKPIMHWEFASDAECGICVGFGEEKRDFLRSDEYALQNALDYARQCLGVVIE